MTVGYGKEVVVGPEEASVVVWGDSYFDGHEQAAVVIPDTNEVLGACRKVDRPALSISLL